MHSHNTVPNARNLTPIETDAHEGLHLLYSNFVTMEGIGIFQEVLHANGFQEFKIKKDKGHGY